MVLLVVEWPIWMLVCQFLCMGTIVWIHGLPASGRHWLVFILANGLLLAFAALEAVKLLDFVVTRSLQAALRLSVVGLWGFMLVGGPLVFRWIWRRRGFGPRHSFPLAKWWFVSVLLLATAEPLAVLIDWHRHRLKFPQFDKMPQASELHVVALGASTMIGHPYDPKFGIPEVFAWRLQQMYPDRKVVLHNLAEEGINLRQAVARLEHLEVRPHHLLLYSGHNEFYHEMEELAKKANNPFRFLDRWLDWSPTFRMLSRPLSERLAVRKTREK